MFLYMTFFIQIYVKYNMLIITYNYDYGMFYTIYSSRAYINRVYSTTLKAIKKWVVKVFFFTLYENIHKIFFIYVVLLNI